MEKMYYGIIEDNIDPLKMGRCRVRIVGLHTKDRNILPIEDLPWAIPVMDFSSNASGLSYKPPVKGTAVVGYFQDNTLQNFFMLGTLPVNYEEKPDSSEGFSDPSGTYPKQTGPLTNPLATNDDRNEIVPKKKNELIQGELFNEPETTYNAEYPFNKVYEDEAGNIVEIDATPGAERIHVYHKSGSFVEFTNDGAVIKIQGDLYEFSKNKNIRVEGDCKIEVDGDATTKVGGSANIEVDGDATTKVGGSANIEVDGDTTTKVGGSANIEVSGNTTLKTSKFFVE